MKPASIASERHGRLVVVERGTSSKDVVVLCDCGVTKTVKLANLRSGRTTSCGCAQRAAAAERFRKHGERASGSRGQPSEYGVWLGMKNRCDNESHRSFRRYGGRGIKVCRGWHASFEAFLADMGRRPTAGHTVERNDNDRGYDCGRCDDCRSRGAAANCRWATRLEQAQNTSRSKPTEGAAA